ncbi:MAG TPA: hypothetical protein VD770_03795 [Coxiellaceae bacterium]|nr:hypothetical protein [Coxiellaceae bacterium]
MLNDHLSYYANAIGVTGVVLVLGLYLLLQLNKLSADNVWFSFLNAIASVFVLISLYYHWNLPSVIIEIVWLMISIYGVIKCFARRSLL